MKPHSESYNKANKQLNLSIFLYKKIIKHFYTLNSKLLKPGR